MTFKESIYGSNNPSIHAKVLGNTFLLGFVLMFYSFYSTYLPSAAWRDLGSKLVWGFAIGVPIYLAWLCLTGRVKPKKQLDRPNQIAGFILLIGLVWVFAHYVIIYGGPALVSSVLDHNIHTEVTVTKKKGSLHRGCRWLLQSSAFRDARSNRLCVSEDFWTQTENGERISVWGYQSWFGTKINAYGRINRGTAQLP